MHIFVSLLMAIAPAIFLVCYFYKQDIKKPEPKGLVIKIFGLGIAFTVPVSLLEVVFDELFGFLMNASILYSFIKAFVVAAFIEEFFKLLVVKKFAYTNPHFDEMMDGIIYTIVASLGFACLENVIYVINDGMEIAFVRAFTVVPMHAVASGVMGFYIGKAKFSETKEGERSLIYKGLCYAVLIHGIYDFLLFASPDLGMGLALGVFPLIIFVFIKLKEMIKFAIADDLHSGRL